MKCDFGFIERKFRSELFTNDLRSEKFSNKKKCRLTLTPTSNFFSRKKQIFGSCIIKFWIFLGFHFLGKAKKIRWSKFSSIDYQEIMDEIIKIYGKKGLWKVEEYWSGYQ